MTHSRTLRPSGMAGVLAFVTAVSPAWSESQQVVPLALADDGPIRTAPVPQVFDLELPLSLNSVYLGDISARISPDGAVAIPVERLITLIEARADAGVRSMLDQLPPGLVSLAELEGRHLVVVYDHTALTLDVRLSADQTGQTALTLRHSVSPSPELREGAAQTAAGLSVISRAAYTHESDFEPSGVQPFRADLSGFIAIGGFDGWTLVGSADYDADRQTQWRRGPVTLIHDDYDRAIRYRAGDVRPRTHGFQIAPDIVGLSVERDYATIQPFRNIQASGRATFTLERPSLVTVEVNGVVTSSLTLPPGPYDVRDFPFAQGANSIRVLVEDEFGVREIASFSSFADIELLGQGLDVFGLSAGRLRDPFSPDGGYAYTDETVVVAHYARGVTDTLTLGAEAEIGDDRSLVGVRAAWGARFGLIAAQVAASRHGGEQAWAGLVRYRLPPVEVGAWTHELDAQIEHRQAGFGSIGEAFTAAFDETRVDARYLVRKGTRFFSAAASHVDGRVRSSFLSLTAGLQWREWTVSATAQYSESDDRLERPHRFLLSLTRRLGRRTTFRARQATSPYEAEVEIQRFSNRRVGDWGGRAAAGIIDRVGQIDGDFVYTASRAELDLSHRSETVRDSSRIRRSVSEARLGMGVGWADGRLAFGRPFTDGFVIVEPHRALADRRIVLREGAGGAVAAVSDEWGRGLAPLRRAYQPETFSAEVDDLPAGYDLGSAQFEAFGGARSGFVYQVGSDAANTVMTHLVDAAGAPVALVSGELRPIGQTDRPAAPFFTNRGGRLVAERVGPGRYAVVLTDGRLAGEIVVPETALGLVELPDLVLQETQP